MTDNEKLQRIEKAMVVCCPHLDGKEKTRMGFPKGGTYNTPLQLVGEGNYLVLCDDCRDKLELSFLRDWLQPPASNSSSSRHSRTYPATPGYPVVRVPPKRGNGDE